MVVCLELFHLYYAFYCSCFLILTVSYMLLICFTFGWLSHVVVVSWREIMLLLMVFLYDACCS